MKPAKSFKSYYEKEMIPLLQPLEDWRKGIYKKMIFIDILIFFFVIVVNIFTALISFPFVIYSIIFGIIISSVLIVINHKAHLKTSGYYNDFKSTVMNSIVGFFGDKFSYDPDRYIAKSEYVQSKIFKKYSYPKIYSGDDLVKGTRGEIKITLSEICSSEKCEIFVYSRGQRREVETERLIFKGLFFATVFPKKFKKEFIATIPKGGLKKSCKFLPQETMKHVYKLSNSRKIYISFIKNKMYVAVECKEDLFEPRISKSLLDYRYIKDYYNYLNFAIETSEALMKDREMWKTGKIEVQDVKLGYEKDIKCPACKKILPEGTSFCIHCGIEMN